MQGYTNCLPSFTEQTPEVTMDDMMDDMMDDFLDSMDQDDSPNGKDETEEGDGQSSHESDCEIMNVKQGSNPPKDSNQHRVFRDGMSDMSDSFLRSNDEVAAQEQRNAQQIFKMQVSSASDTNEAERELFPDSGELSQIAENEDNMFSDPEAKISEISKTPQTPQTPNPDLKARLSTFLSECRSEVKHISKDVSLKRNYKFAGLFKASLDEFESSIANQLYRTLEITLPQLRAIQGDIIRYIFKTVLSNCETLTPQLIASFNKKTDPVWRKLMQTKYGQDAHFMIFKHSRLDEAMSPSAFRANLLDRFADIWPKVESLYCQQQKSTLTECFKLYQYNNGTQEISSHNVEYRQLSKDVCQFRITIMVMFALYSGIIVCGESGFHKCKHGARKSSGDCLGYTGPDSILNMQHSHKCFMHCLQNIMSTPYSVFCNPVKKPKANMWVLSQEADFHFVLTKKYISQKTPEIEWLLALFRMLVPVIGIAGANQQNPPCDHSDFLALLLEAEMTIKVLYDCEEAFHKRSLFDEYKSYDSDGYRPRYKGTKKKKKTRKCPKGLGTLKERIDHLYEQLQHSVLMKGRKQTHTVLAQIVNKKSHMLVVVDSPFSSTGSPMYSNLYGVHKPQGHTLEVLPCGQRISTLTPTQVKLQRLTNRFLQRPEDKPIRNTNNRITVKPVFPKPTNVSNTNNRITVKPVLQKATTVRLSVKPDRSTLVTETSSARNDKFMSGKKQGWDHWTKLYTDVNQAFDNYQSGFLQYLCQKFAARYPAYPNALHKLKQYLLNPKCQTHQDKWSHANVDNHKSKNKKRSRNGSTNLSRKKRRTC